MAAAGAIGRNVRAVIDQLKNAAKQTCPRATETTTLHLRFFFTRSIAARARMPAATAAKRPPSSQTAVLLVSR